ncbi:MAG: MBL fold metallo-hydrolase [Candidatus Krumholzibacteria bacterium]|jgi:ribonuclease Z|nr:MBL fold metallo-hydrolase [Candidatus Krumholzibacteria bacterium]MDP6669407.1 MBL fold metallo-hydrolase [Candidatus Krumholzibacteria bacterium]MDP6798021.1 MBL fold metallo-hydrolase [Candidatus Krumholzibacteria bacterium]MDP7021532.1 MBL fold metallo-hydrolase [Candidatus Krumholzibacteria bacterium]
MNDILTGYSKALYSSWYYYRPARLLLDGGEGIVQTMGKKIFGIRKVFFTHGHEDHIAGLPSLVNLRNLSNGDREIPLSIYYPEGDPFIAYLQDYLEKKQKHRLRYAMEWTALRPGEFVEVEVARRQTRVNPFPVRHARGWQCLGYRIEEKRQVPRPEYRGADTAEMGALIREKGKSEVLETVWHPMLAYTGDSLPIEDVSTIAGSDVLLIDSTFTNRKEMEGSRHGNIVDSFRAASEAGVKHLVLVHLSGRYLKRDIMAAIEEGRKLHGSPQRLGYYFEGRYHSLDGDSRS